MIAYQPRHLAPTCHEYVAVCPDRRIRHVGTFPDVRTAGDWATRLHRCQGQHRVLAAEVAPLFGGDAAG